jgi:hypothetical protein
MIFKSVLNQEQKSAMQTFAALLQDKSLNNF